MLRANPGTPQRVQHLAANYGTEANYQANYRLTTSFVDARKGPFLTNNRIWIGGYLLYQTDISDYGHILTSEETAA